MKKIIAIILSVITIVVCGWLIVDRLDYLDIPSNKNDQNAAFQKQMIINRSDIDECEKTKLCSNIDFRREKERALSSLAFTGMFIAFVIILIQLVLLVFIFMMPRKLSKDELLRLNKPLE